MCQHVLNFFKSTVESGLSLASNVHKVQSAWICVKVGEFRFERVGEFSFIKKNTCMSFETSLWMTVAWGWFIFEKWVIALESG